MRKLILAGVLCLVSGAALAQQVGAPAPEKDAKDLQIEFTNAQRNDALTTVASCFANANFQINVQNKQITEIKAQLAKANADLEASQKALKDAQAAAAPSQ